MEARVSRLESQLEAGMLATQELIEKRVAQMEASMQNWKDEIMEVLRLNRPPPPGVDPTLGSSSFNGIGPTRELPGNPQQGRREGKAPADPDGLADLEEEFAAEHTPVNFGRRGDWAPMRAPHQEPPIRHNHDQLLLRYKAEFPPFDYDHPRLWIYRCERFFMLSHIPRDDVMSILYVNLSGKVGLWFEGYLNGLRRAFRWTDFSEAVCRRFGEDGGTIMDDFTYLRQVGGVQDFTDRFEEFRSLLLHFHPYLMGSYFLQAYVARLKSNLRCFVRTARPESLADAIWLAKQFEKGLKGPDQPKSSNQYLSKSFPHQNSQFTQSTLSKPTETKPVNPSKPTVSNSLSSTGHSPEIARFKAQLREQNKCFKCFEPWQPGHRCKGPTFNIIEEEESHEALGLERGEQEDTEVAGVSLCAVIGGEGMNTIKLLGQIQKQQVVILVDSGSTHSFLDPKLLS